MNSKFLPHVRRRGMILIEFVIAIAVFAFAALAIARHLGALHGAVNNLRREAYLNAALASAVAEARTLAANLQPGQETDAAGLTVRREFKPLNLRNEKQVEIRGLSLMTIQAFYEGEPPAAVELYVARP